MTKQAAPDNLLKFISCTCRKGCGAACGCRKAGLKCSVVCGFCSGQSCENVPEVHIDIEDEDDQDLTMEEQYIPISTDYDDTEDNTQNVINNRPGPSKKRKR